VSESTRDADWQRLLDQQSLRELALRYARAIDRRAEAALLELYHEDAIDSHGTVFHGSPKEYAEFQPRVMAQFAVTAHYIVNTLYAIDGDYAEGELYFIAYHRFRGEASEPIATAGAGKELFIGGRYLDKYARRSGAWKFMRRDLVWDFARTISPTAEDAGLLASLGAIGAGREDVSAALLPLLATGRRPES
jgi:hypothetical protein